MTEGFRLTRLDTTANLNAFRGPCPLNRLVLAVWRRASRADANTPQEQVNITMKAVILLAAVLLAGMPAVSQADLPLLRQLDDMTFDTMNDARQLRWLIRSEFIEAPGVGLLLNDSQMLLFQLRGLEDVLFRELPIQIVFEQLNQVRASAAQLRFSLTTPCAACVKPEVIFYGGERFVVEEPRPVIVVPTELALEMLARIEGKLQSIEDVVLGRVVPAADALPPGGVEGVAPGLDAQPPGPLNDGVLLNGGLPVDGGLPSGGALPAGDGLPMGDALPMGGGLPQGGSAPMGDPSLEGVLFGLPSAANPGPLLAPSGQI